MTQEAALTVIGPSVIIRGTIQGDEDLRVLGRVEGRVNLKRTLVVEQGGWVKAEVAVNGASIAGTVVGNLVASGWIELSETARVVGDLKAPRMIIQAGAQFTGSIDMGKLEVPQGSAKPQAAPRTTQIRAPAPVAAAAAKEVASPPDASEFLPELDKIRKRVVAKA